MSECNHECSSCSIECSSRKPESMIEAQNKHSNIKKVIGVVSGKGGVGKSLVTSLMAAGMKKRNFSTAVLDADITGPSVPKMFGVNKRATAADDCLIPCESKSGVKLMSVNLLLENATDPVIWRGPIIAGTVKQFWTDVLWGDIDFMFVDMPPGTGDVPLTVFQSLPVDGIIVVTSPQDLVSMIVEKAVNMAKMMDIPILGIVENMSYALCTDCGKKIFIYGESNPRETAEKYNTKLLGQIPMLPETAKMADGGMIEDLDSAPWLTEAFEEIEKLIK